MVYEPHLVCLCPSTVPSGSGAVNDGPGDGLPAWMAAFPELYRTARGSNSKAAIGEPGSCQIVLALGNPMGGGALGQFYGEMIKQIKCWNGLIS